jgi:hypothetical protein
MWYFFIHMFIPSINKLFACEMCFQHMIFMCKMYKFMNEWINFTCMNKFHIINSSHGKFVMIISYSWLPTKIYHKNLMIWIFFQNMANLGFFFHENPLYESNSYFSN